MIKNLLTQEKTEEENQKIGGGVPLIDRELSGNILLINREFVELKNDVKYTSLPKLTELVKKSSNLTKTGKEKPHRPISHFLAYFIGLVE